MRVLISGSSIAGPTLAYWLARSGFEPTLIERAPEPRPGGQAIDVRGAALRVLKGMELLDAARDLRTQMKGASILDAEGNEVWRSDRMTFTGGNFASGDIEILRDDLSRILLEKVGDSAELIYGDAVTGLNEDADGVSVTFEKGPSRRFDLVVGADGLHSNIRKLWFGDESQFLRHLGVVLAVYSVPNHMGLKDWQLAYRVNDSNCLIYTARNNTELRVGFGFAGSPADEHVGDLVAQKTLLQEKFRHFRWEVPKLLDAMWNSGDFWLGAVAQVRMARWTKGRVALVGDAGYCPSPFSGQGTSLALVGAYLLAHELSQSPASCLSAFTRYEEKMRPYVEMNQEIADLARNEQIISENIEQSRVLEALNKAKDGIVLDGLPVVTGPLTCTADSPKTSRLDGSDAPLSPAVAKPAHIPDELVYDYDAYRDPELLADPSKRIARMVKEAPPVFWTPRNGGQWIIQGYEALFKAYRDPDTFSSSFASPEQMKAMAALLPPGMPRVPQARPIGLDPPEHTKYRGPLQKTFSPKAALALKDEIRQLANELVEAVADKGHCDFMPAVAEQLPVRVFIKMFGLPLERHEEYRALAKEHLAGITTDPAAQTAKTLRLVDVMRDTIIERRDQPKDDILSMLWQTTIDGQPTSMQDMEDYAVLLFIAGLDTVVNGMGLTMRHLATDPSLQDELRSNPKIIPEAVEEMLRRYTFTVPVRRVAKDVLYEGAPMKAGERVLMYDPAADLDPTKFRDPEVYDMNREDKTHIAFGAGPHRCLGSHLARIELQIATDVVLSRLSNIRLDPDHPPRYHGGHVIGPDSLPLVWDVLPQV